MAESCLVRVRAGLLSLGTLFSLSGAHPLIRGENSQPWPRFHLPWSMTNAANWLPADRLAWLWEWEGQLEKTSSWAPHSLLLSGLGPSPAAQRQRRLVLPSVFANIMNLLNEKEWLINAVSFSHWACTPPVCWWQVGLLLIGPGSPGLTAFLRGPQRAQDERECTGSRRTRDFLLDLRIPHKWLWASAMRLVVLKAFDGPVLCKIPRMHVSAFNLLTTL